MPALAYIAELVCGPNQPHREPRPPIGADGLEVVRRARTFLGDGSAESGGLKRPDGKVLARSGTRV
jgi:hypothetical protein